MAAALNGSEFGKCVVADYIHRGVH